MQKLDIPQEEVWDIKRIAFAFTGGVILLTGGGLAFKTFVIDQYSPEESAQEIQSGQPQSVLGTESQQEIRLSLPDKIPSAEELKEKLEGIKRDVEKLTIDDVASSSPQLQKVVNDLKTLQEYPKNQVKEACLNICSGL